MSRRAFPAIVFGILASTSFLASGLIAGPPSAPSPPEYPQIGLPNPAEARALLEQFRGAGLAAGDYYFEFTLRHRPRRGDESRFRGRLWGGRDAQGMVLRLSVWDSAGAERRFLVQDGPEPGAWREAGGAVASVEGAALFEPLADGIEITAFDLQMPYLYWPDFRVEGLDRVLNRPAYAFLFRPPEAVAAANPRLAWVRVFIDTEFDRPVEVELIGPEGSVLKTVSLVDLQRVQGQWLLKTFDVRDEVTRDYTRFSLTAAALGISLPPGVLSRSGLGAAVAPPPASRVLKLAP